MVVDTRGIMRHYQGRARLIGLSSSAAESLMARPASS
jgi:hypothetical protein